MIEKFVLIDNKEIGKINSVNEDKTVDVEIFFNISNIVVKNFNMNQLKYIELSNQTRTYYKKDDKWSIGRIIDKDVLDNGSIDYEVQFPNKEKKWISEKSLHVRSLKNLLDPTDVLAFSYGETQYLHDARMKILNWIINLRESVSGLTALSSSSIELVVHQINVAKKILSDPIQRYLLSDEVGMGKTIESGIIARQCLLDDDLSTVLVIVPKHLKKKWEMELFSKFYLNDFDERIEIISVEEIQNINYIPTLLIIDEAHNIVTKTSKYLNNEKELIINLAINSEKLLILSATPGIGNEEILLSLLKILDPFTFGEEDIEQFKIKLNKQREQGVFLRILNPNISEFLLKRNLAKVSNLFPNDSFCLDYSTRILELIENGKDFKKEINELKIHITETWNFNNRLIRTRRRDTEGWEFQSRGNIIDEKCSQEHLQLFINPNNVYENINFQIENWRAEVSLLIDSLPKLIQQKLEIRYIELLEKSNDSLEVFKLFLKKSKNDILFKSELELLEKIELEIDDYAFENNINLISNKIMDFLNSFSETSVGIIFVDDINLGKLYFSSLKKLLRNKKIIILDDFLNQELDLSVCFEDKDLRLIIVDKKNEEGIDLQFADVMIHLDLLFNVSRIEQRIGRLDRFGRKKSQTIQHLIILPTDNEEYPWINWFDLLIDGFKVFNEPISDIQLKIEDINIEIYSGLLKHGSSSLYNHYENGEIVSKKIEYINCLIENEREYLDEQYALNHLALSETDSLNLRDIIEEGEYDEHTLEIDIDYWLFNVLKFYKHNIDKKRFEIKWSNTTLIPKQLFWAKKFELSLNRELTYYRNKSIEYKNASLLRPGHPLFDAIKDYLDWEDRGTTFSTFRVVDEKFPKFIPKGSIEIFFKLTFFTGVNNTLEETIFNKNTFLRRCDEYVSPKIFTLFIDESMNVIEDKDILEALNEPYVKDRFIDTNLTNKPEIIEKFIEKKIFIELCRKISFKAKDLLVNSKIYEDYINKSLENAQNDILLRCNKLERRNKINENKEITKLINFENLILESIKNHDVKLDSFGLFFLSRFPIDELGLEIE